MALLGRVTALPGELGNILQGRNVYAPAVRAIAPVVVGTLDRVPLDAAIAQVGESTAAGVEDDHLAMSRAKRDQPSAEKVLRKRTGAQFPALAEKIPADRVGRKRSAAGASTDAPANDKVEVSAMFVLPSCGHE